MDGLNKIVDDLYNFRDRFFDFHDIKDAVKKPSLVKKKMEETLKELEKADKTTRGSASYMMLHGKALNVDGKHNPIAEEMLSKAVKLDPNLIDAWMNLGECYWKKGDIQSAHNCFQSAVNRKKDKVALRNLSMITRSLGSTEEEKIQNVQISFEMAKEAVQMDPGDGQSWTILGNAYVAMYFSTDQNPNLTRQAISAFSQAEKDTASVNSYDLHYNKGVIHEYLENFSEALDSYAMAKSIDPTFSEVVVKEKKLSQYVQKYSSLVNTKGGLKKKRLKELQKMINYEQDCTMHPLGQEHQVKALPDLLYGDNPKALFVGRVIGSLNVNDPVCFTFALIDKLGSCVGVTLYNAARDWGLVIGDSVLITRPILRLQNFSHSGNMFNFKSIRVDSPRMLMVNGRAPPSVALAPTKLIQSMQNE